MPDRVIIADTSCLIGLNNIRQLDLLHELYNTVTITHEVKDEFGEALPDWITVKNAKDKIRQTIIELELDRGEASAIALALESKNSLLIIDERKGRKVASRLGIKKLGTLGILVQAKEMGLIEKLEPLLLALKKIDFRISDSLIKDILKRVGEK